MVDRPGPPARVAVVTVGDPARRTGGYRYHARVFALLRARGITIDELVASADPSPDGQRAASATLGPALEHSLAAADVVVVDALAAQATGRWLDDWRRARPLVAMVHELPSVAGGPLDDAARDAEDALLRADVLIAVSDHGRSILSARGAPHERIVVAPPGADWFPGSPPVPPAGDPRVLAVAQWIPRKGIDTLLAAWRLLAHPSAWLDLVGETDADVQTTRRVRRQLADMPGARIVVHGTLDDRALSARYQAASLFALPTRYEGYGIVFAEALLHGLPVVTTTVGPVPEVVGPDAGMFVSPDDPASFAAAIRRVLDDPTLRASMRAAALQRAACLPRWELTATRVAEALALALAMRRRGTAGP